MTYLISLDLLCSLNVIYCILVVYREGPILWNYFLWNTKYWRFRRFRRIFYHGIINTYCEKYSSVFRKTLQFFPWNTTIFFLNHRLLWLYYFFFSFTSITCPSASATTFRPVSPFSCTLMNFIVTSLPSIYSEQEYPNFSFFNCCIILR